MLLMRRSFAEAKGYPVIGTFRAFKCVGVKPDEMGVGPAEAIPQVLDQCGLRVDDIDVFEINEAFASQAAYVLRTLKRASHRIASHRIAVVIGRWSRGCGGWLAGLGLTVFCWCLEEVSAECWLLFFCVFLGCCCCCCCWFGWFTHAARISFFRYCVRKLAIPLHKLNPNGGAISLGHPLGMTGARMVATCLHELRRTNKKLGIVSMCIGTGMGAAAVVEAE